MQNGCLSPQPLLATRSSAGTRTVPLALFPTMVRPDGPSHRDLLLLLLLLLVVVVVVVMVVVMVVEV